MSNLGTAQSESRNPTFLQRMAVFVTTGAGIGFVPWAPGTFGTLWGIPLAWAVGLLPSLWWQCLAIFGLFALGLPMCTLATSALGRGKDPGAIVWDEIIAMPVVFFGLPVNWFTVVLGFALFRLFDTTKPWPASRAEKLPDAWGVMTDDIVAGIYASIALNIVLWFWPGSPSLG